LDELPRELFEEGFGLSTPVLTFGQKVCKYYSYTRRLLEKARTLVLDQYVLTPYMAAQVASANTPEDLIRATKLSAIMVTVPIMCRAAQGALEGTRITASLDEERGPSFEIRIPGTPERYTAFEPHLQRAFEGCRHSTATPHPGGSLDEDEVVAEYYRLWINLQPVSRGSAILGLIAVIAIYLARGQAFDELTEVGRQPDWEGLLWDGEDFVKGFGAHLRASKKSADGVLQSIMRDPDHSIQRIFPSLRKALWALEVSVDE